MAAPDGVLNGRCTPMRSTLTPTKTYPHVVFDTRGRYWTASVAAPGSGRVALTRPHGSRRSPCRRSGTETRTNRRRRQDRRWTPAAPAGPTLPNPCGGELAVHEKTGERTPEVPLAWRSPGTSQEHLAPTTEPSGTLNNARGNPTPSRRIPPPPLLPPPGSQDRWARLALTPPIQMPDAATQQAQPEQQLPNQRQRRHRLRHHRLRFRCIGHGQPRPA